MFNKLRYRFIAIAMASVALVFAIIMTTINIINYAGVNSTLDTRMDVIIATDILKNDIPARVDSPVTQEKAPQRLWPDKLKLEDVFDISESDVLPKVNAEAEFDIRYFTVSLNTDGTVLSINTGQIAATSTKDASAYATMLYEKEKTEGIIDNYKYKAVKDRTSTQKQCITYIFMDCERELDTFHHFLAVSITISIVGTLVIFFIIVFASKAIIRPMAESYEKQKRFITDASHEIKTPLTIIDANTEILEMESGESEWTQSIRNQIARLTSLTEKMVFLSRMDEESTKLPMMEFAISDTILDIAYAFEPVASTQGKHLHINIEERASYCGDEASIRQLVSILLDNAMKYTSDGGEIRLDFHTNGKSRVFCLWNTVDEIEQGRHDELFERFYRPDESRSSETGGYGIGLSVAKAIVNAHRGKISAKSEDGKSIVFTVTLN